MSEARLLQGDALTVLKTQPGASVRCCVTSPPYWGLRDYGMPGQLGLERTPEEYVGKMVEVFREVRRVLADDGTLWLNLGDSYGRGFGGGTPGEKSATNVGSFKGRVGRSGNKGNGAGELPMPSLPPGIKGKDLVGIPWMVAFALRADGWYLRSDIIWAKPNPMPESVTDRPTKSHEYLFLLSKQERYYYDAAAIRTEYKPDSHTTARAQRTSDGNKSVPTPERNGIRRSDKQRGHSRRHAGFNDRWDAMERSEQQVNGANARSVWTIATMPYKGAHFATFPEELARRCILAGSAPGDTCLDPFGGSGTVAQVATGNARNAIMVELNPAYLLLARQRIGPLLCGGA